uniref:Carboxylesterase type B domain-containing protein n=1 Tax=Trichobilharzia regenti TaxID=157069 RepID=A0AA85IK42_TRIRE|nr:unnamed protein product [Trichobilharzia regenti]
MNTLSGRFSSESRPSAKDNQKYENEEVIDHENKQDTNITEVPEIITTQQTLSFKPYLSFDSLLMDSHAWKKRVRNERLRRQFFLLVTFILLLVFILSHLPIIIWKTWKFQQLEMKIEQMNKHLALDRDIHPACIITSCATLCPEVTNITGWYTLHNLPYATLPHQNAYFAESTTPYTFEECYVAYWHSVSKYKRKFKDGRIQFFGREEYDDDDTECAQLRLRNNSQEKIPIGKPHSCLTLSFHYPLFNKGENKRLLPIVVYIGGDYLLNHRPRLISTRMAATLEIIYITVNYRLGIFGFSDFNLHISGANNGVKDVREALTWIQTYGHTFSGNTSSVMIYGENSGATIGAVLLASSKTDMIYVNGSWVAPFTHMWLSDGSVVIPRTEEHNEHFKILIMNDPDLKKACDQWLNENVEEKNYIERSHPLGKMYQCLSKVTVNDWLKKTPINWIYSKLTDENQLPSPNEYRSTIIKRDEGKSKVYCPLCILASKSSEDMTNGNDYDDKIKPNKINKLRSIPLVLFSSLNWPVQHHLPLNNSFEHYTLKQVETSIRETFDTLHRMNNKLPKSNLIWNIYKPYLNKLISRRKIDQIIEHINYKQLHDAIRIDLRVTCLYNLYGKMLKSSVKHFSRNASIFRLLNRIPPYPYINNNNDKCDIPFFLTDSQFNCGRNTRPAIQKSNPNDQQILIDVFRQFVEDQYIYDALELPKTRNMGVHHVQAYNVISEQGIVTLGEREIMLLSACGAWLMDDIDKYNEDSFNHMLKYGKYN